MFAWDGKVFNRSSVANCPSKEANAGGVFAFGIAVVSSIESWASSTLAANGARLKAKSKIISTTALGSSQQ
jgi:hypothetical protein